MNSHLSEDQMSRSFIGRSTIQEEQHLQSCAQCQAELDGLRRTCSLFRDAMKDLANHRMAAGTLPKAATFVTPRRFVPVPWQLALVSAAVLLFAILPLYWNQDFQPSQPQFGETAAGWTETGNPPASTDDVVLMEAVTAHLARPIPAPMEAVMALLPRGEMLGGQREATVEIKAPGGPQ